MSSVYYTLCLKNAPTLASCTFDEHGLILIVFGEQHQHTFKNDTRVQLFLSLHFYLLYLLLNSCDGNDAFWRHCMLVKQSTPAPLAGNVGFYLQICVRQTIRLTTEFVDWCRNVCTFYKHISTTPAAVTGDIKQRLIVTCTSISQNAIDKAVGQWRKWLVQAWRQNDTTLDICLTKNLLFSEPPTVYTEGNTLFRVIISIAVI